MSLISCLSELINFHVLWFHQLAPVLHFYMTIPQYIFVYSLLVVSLCLDKHCLLPWIASWLFPCLLYTCSIIGLSIIFCPVTFLDIIINFFVLMIKRTNHLLLLIVFCLLQCEVDCPFYLKTGRSVYHCLKELVTPPPSPLSVRV